MKDVLDSIGLFAAMIGVAGVFLVGLIVAIAMSLPSGKRDVSTTRNQDGDVSSAQVSVAPEFVGHSMYDTSYEYDMENPWDRIDFMRRLAR